MSERSFIKLMNENDRLMKELEAGIKKLKEAYSGRSYFESLNLEKIITKESYMI